MLRVGDIRRCKSVALIEWGKEDDAGVFGVFEFAVKGSFRDIEYFFSAGEEFFIRDCVTVGEESGELVDGDFLGSAGWVFRGFEFLRVEIWDDSEAREIPAQDEVFSILEGTDEELSGDAIFVFVICEGDTDIWVAAPDA